MEAVPHTQRALLVSALIAAFGLTGCGMPGAPQPPSLNLPQTVKDLHAARNGSQITLGWTMPRRNTDQMLLKAALPVRVCLIDSHELKCVPSGAVTANPAAATSFQLQLPADLAQGTPRPVGYYVEVLNAKGRSAGPSNVAHVAAGQAPPPVVGLAAEPSKNGVLLHWNPAGADATPVRLERHLLSTPAPPDKNDPLAPPAEPVELHLLVSSQPEAGRALDRSVRLNETYQFRAQRVARVKIGDETLELASAYSDPVRIQVKDIFPPDAPTGLAAVAAAPETGPAIDLNWQPNTEADLVGYIVYRREAQGEWARLSPAEPLTGPAFHDARALPGHTYQYAVTAINQGGHQSPRSAMAEETVPAE